MTESSPIVRDWSKRAAAMMSSKKPDWCTPEVILDCVREVSTIGLDPCPSPFIRPFAACNFLEDDGLAQNWRGHGLVYCNPPYGRGIANWTRKAVDEFGPYAAPIQMEGWEDELIMLVPARTDTRWWQDCIVSARAVCFWRGRLTFQGAPAGAPFPSALIYFGRRPERFVEAFRKKGWVIDR